MRRRLAAALLGLAAATSAEDAAPPPRTTTVPLLLPARQPRRAQDGEPNGGESDDGNSLEAAEEAEEVAQGQLLDIASNVLGDGGDEDLPEVMRSYNGWEFPEIPPGVPTVIMQVPFPAVTEGPEAQDVARAQGAVVSVCVFSMLVFTMPAVIINGRFCCRGFRRCCSRNMRLNFCLGLIINISMVSCVIRFEPTISANGLFFTGVKLLEKFTDKLQNVLTQVGILFAMFVVFTLRKRIMALFGFEQSLMRADLRDILTCFSMKRFQSIEIAIWRCEGLPCGMSTRTLFVRVLLGYNEPMHSRPHDGCHASLVMRETLQVNYDPHDDTQKCSIIVKQQEVIGDAVAGMAPAAGAMFGGAGGLVTPLGPMNGALGGMVMGIGAANSFGKEVARIDFSSAMLNRLREATQKKAAGRSVNTAKAQVAWREEDMFKVDLVPQGAMWLRITDVNEV